MRAFALAVALCLPASLVACGDSSAPAYDVEIVASPQNLIPDQPVSIDVIVTRDGLAAGDVVVAAAATRGADVLDLGALTAEQAGVFVTRGATFGEGEWLLVAAVSGPEGEVQSELPLTVTCEGDGTPGAACCGADACAGGLICVAGSCAAALAPSGAGCYGPSDCGDGVCDTGFCAAARCDDGVQNGGEAGIDCGGGCGRVCVPVLGAGTHDFSRVSMVPIASRADGLSRPTDLAINPDAPDQLWVTNKTESVTVLAGFGKAGHQPRTFASNGTQHFLAKPISLAFGEVGVMATCHDTDDYTQGAPPFGTPRTFMGPTLWPTSLDHFDAGHGSHLDMLHNTPLCGGIAWEQGRIFWLFDGYHQSLTRYDFQGDHGMGGADHSDGLIWRYAEGQVSRVAGVPSHLVYDHDTSLLYVNDTGNARIAVFDPAGAVDAGAIQPNYDGVVQRHMSGGVMTTLVDAVALGLQQPAGMAIGDDGIVYVSDHATSRIWAFDKLSGEALDYLETELPAGSLKGLELDSLGRLYVVDSLAEQVYRIAPAE